MKRNERNVTIFILGLFILIPLIIIIKDGDFVVKNNKKFKFTISKPVDSEIKTKANKKEIVNSKIPSEKKIAEATTIEVATTEITTTEEPKEVSQDAVKKKYKNAKLLSMHTISNYASSQDRNNNLMVACKIINGKEKGYLLQPGERFSWISVVGQTTEDKGFKKAPVIVGNRHIDGLGGGVCQVASAINSACVDLGMKTCAQRHSVPVGYIKSEDSEATVSAEGGVDFTFENSYKFPIRIKMKAEGCNVTAKIYKVKEV